MTNTTQPSLEALIAIANALEVPDRYYEIAKNVGIVENRQKNGTVNVQVNDTSTLSQLT